jgi:hypothetical protein
MPFLPYWIYRNINSQWKNVYVRNLLFNVTLKDVSIMYGRLCRRCKSVSLNLYIIYGF